MEAGVVFAGCTIPPDGLPMTHPYPVAGPRARSGRDGVGVVCLCLGSSGWSPLAAMVPILCMSVGGYRPQFPVKESIRSGCLVPAVMNIWRKEGGSASAPTKACFSKEMCCPAW